MEHWQRLLTAIATESTSFSELESAANALQAWIDAGGEVPNLDLANMAIAYANELTNSSWSDCR